MRSASAFVGIVVATIALVAGAAYAQSTAEVAVVDSAFQPAEVTVDAGGTVTWTQTGSLPHSVTADDGSFDSHPDCGDGDCMGAGDTFRHTFDAAGTYAYYCRVHGAPGGVGMSGTVTVTAATQPTAEPTADDPAEEPTADDPAEEPTATEEPVAEEPADTDPTEEAVAGEDSTAGDAASAEELAETGAPAGALLVVAALLVLVGVTAARRHRIGD